MRAKFEVQKFGWISWSQEHLNSECVYNELILL